MPPTGKQRDGISKDLGQNLSNNAMRQQQDFMCILRATGKLN